MASAYCALLGRGDRTWTGQATTDATWAILVSVSSQIVADFIIAVASFTALHKHRGTEYASTRTAINKLTYYTIGTCLAPTLFAILRLVLVSCLNYTAGNHAELSTRT
jgi:Mn2+/Fe2+ NRAMP family transporter